jgi:UDP-N-acetylglucosamine 2-epimerase (non-hydrolysing)
MKVAPIMRAFSQYPEVSQTLIHTGQHYDSALSDGFFEDLGLPEPNLNLGIGSASHAAQTGRMLIAIEPVLTRLGPDWVFTVGDVNSTLAAALVASKLHIPVAHVEAGLRSFDREMPEEINRVLTDSISTALFTTEQAANDNLKSEGVPAERIHFVGNVMIDTLDRFRPRAAALAVHRRLDLESRGYALVTLHRPRNVDDTQRLAALLEALAAVAYETRSAVVLPLHPRTATQVSQSGLEDLLKPLITLAPLGYLDFLSLMDQAGVVITDSGGIQEETTVLRPGSASRVCGLGSRRRTKARQAVVLGRPGGGPHRAHHRRRAIEPGTALHLLQ